MIDVNNAFIAVIEGRVIYDGRAFSTLDTGTYLIIRKSDGSFQVHNRSNVKPINYQRPKSKISCDDGNIICLNGKEKIIVEIDNIVNFVNMDLSDNKVVISRTEKDLVDKMVANIESFIDTRIDDIIREYQTPVGNIDIMVLGEVNYAIEMKRKSGTIKDCTQIKRYRDYLCESMEVVGVLACPQILKNAAKYLKDNNMEYFHIDFD